MSGELELGRVIASYFAEAFLDLFCGPYFFSSLLFAGIALRLTALLHADPHHGAGWFQRFPVPLSICWHA
jgi:hypothetical protein